MRISLVVLTFNRAETVRRAMDHNLANASHPIDELVWIDNGSTDHVHDVMRGYNPDVSVLNKRNLGVSKGYNRGFALATGDYIVTTECDMLMPDGWLALFRAYTIALPNTGIVCMFHTARKQPILTEHGFAYQPGNASGRFFVRRELLTRHIGYLREDLGLYGSEDAEWEQRALRVCERHGLMAYAIPYRYPIHLGTMGLTPYDGKDDVDYHAFKAIEARDPQKYVVLRQLREDGFPYFNPYA